MENKPETDTEIDCWDIAQLLCVLRTSQEMGDEDHELASFLKRKMESSGGPSEINKELKAKDPDHPLLEEIEGLNWAWLYN